ncbi:MAG: LacI family DNA-binding transcriptional regulator [Candidatus Limnocylindria bacterium]
MTTRPRPVTQGLAVSAGPMPRRGHEARVTVEDVGRAAGVSPATVSRVVNQNPRVTPETRAAVQRAIEQLGYVPNRAARSLMTRRSDSVGVVILEPPGRLFADPFFGLLMLGIGAGLSEREIQLVLLMAPTAQDEERVERYLAAGHVDGAILVGPHGEDPLPRRLAEAGIPVVLSGRPFDQEGVSFVDSDNRTGARSAVLHLAERGRTRIATIHGTLDLTSGRDRLEGYRDGLRVAGLAHDPTLEAAGDFSTVGAAEAMRSLLERHPDLDGVFAASDSMAATALIVLGESGRRVPEDVAVVGFDDTPTATASRPSLSTVRQPIEAMGREMARLLLQHVDAPAAAPQRIIFPTELIVRESSGGATPHDDSGGSRPRR